jgi:phosphoribosylformylglycinamidine synthase
MKNDYGTGEKKISIPPTLLFSLFGDHPDVRFTATSDLKQPGDRLYLVGRSHDELGASEISFMLKESGEASGVGGTPPQLEHPERNLAMYRALSTAIQTGLIQTAHDCSEGGVGVAVAEMCIGGRLGATIDLDGTGHESLWARLWGESLGRFVVAVKPEKEHAFLAWMSGQPTTFLGEAVEGPNLTICDGYDEILTADVEAMVASWQGALDMTGGVE